MEIKKLAFILILVVLSNSTLLSGQQTDSVRLKKIVTELASDEYMGRGFGSEGGRMAEAYIIRQFEESGIRPFVEGYVQIFDHRQGILNITGHNIIGIIEGVNPDLKDEYIILGAHYDHLGWELNDGDTVVYNGADDNASGVASIIEIGRVLSADRERLGRSVILVAFDGEESGLIGSKAFVSELIEGPEAMINKEDVVAMFSLDMVGMYYTNGGLELQGIELLTDHEHLLVTVNENTPVNIKKSDGNIPNRTDTAPFGAIGIPAVHLFTGTVSPYHKPEDDSDLLEYKGMSEVADFMTGLTYQIAALPEVNISGQLEKMGEGDHLKYFNPGVAVNIGSSYHNFRDYYSRAKSVFAYGAGLTFQTRLTQWLCVQPEVMYEWCGSQVEGGALHTHAVTVPFSLLLTTPDQGFGSRAYYQMGGYYSYAFAGNETGTALDLINDFSQTEYGVLFGFGFEVMNVRMGYVFKRSLVDFTVNDIPDRDTRLYGSFFRVGWVF